MNIFALCSAAVFFLVSPSPDWAQNTGRIDCPRNDGYVYLYSSIVTMDVRATLQCNEVVQITGRYDNYYSVRNAKGDTGYVPLYSIVLLKAACRWQRLSRLLENARPMMHVRAKSMLRHRWLLPVSRCETTRPCT